MDYIKDTHLHTYESCMIKKETPNRKDMIKWRRYSTPYVKWCIGLIWIFRSMTKTFVCILTVLRVNVDDKLLEQIIPEPHITELVYKNWFSTLFFRHYFMYRFFSYYKPYIERIVSYIASISKTKVFFFFTYCSVIARYNDNIHMNHNLWYISSSSVNTHAQTQKQYLIKYFKRRRLEGSHIISLSSTQRYIVQHGL